MTVSKAVSAAAAVRKAGWQANDIARRLGAGLEGFGGMPHGPVAEVQVTRPEMSIRRSMLGMLLAAPRDRSPGGRRRGRLWARFTVGAGGQGPGRGSCRA